MKAVIKKEDVPFKYQPSCEQEVVFAFGFIAKRLGFEIEDIGTAFPDCKGKHNGKKVKIEFEYRTRDFIMHKHPANGCDLIVCWENNAKIQKPKVISLKKHFPFALPQNPNLTFKKDFSINETVYQRIIEFKGISYLELKKLLGYFSKKNINERIRCIARLYDWKCSPYASGGKLKIRHKPPLNRKYAVAKNERAMKNGRALLKELETQWKENSKRKQSNQENPQKSSRYNREAGDGREPMTETGTHGFGERREGN